MSAANPITEREYTDPYRKSGSGDRDTPTVESVAIGVCQHPELVVEILRRLAYTEPEQLLQLRDAIDAAIQNRNEVILACAQGRFGRDYVAPLADRVRERNRGGKYETS